MDQGLKRLFCEPRRRSGQTSTHRCMEKEGRSVFHPRRGLFLLCQQSKENPRQRRINPGNGSSKRKKTLGVGSLANQPGPR